MTGGSSVYDGDFCEVYSESFIYGESYEKREKSRDSEIPPTQRGSVISGQESETPKSPYQRDFKSSRESECPPTEEQQSMVDYI